MAASIRTSIVFSSSVGIGLDDLQRRLDRAGRRMVSSTQAKISGTSSPANAPLTTALKGSSKPLRDTGALMASINHRVEGLTVRVGTNRLGARINQQGGTIQAKPGKMLWIPASRAVKTRLAGAGGSIGRLLNRYRRSYWLYRKGNAFFARPKRGDARKEVMLFILRRSVTIPARPFLYVDDKDEQMLRSVFSGFVEKGV